MRPITRSPVAPMPCPIRLTRIIQLVISRRQLLSQPRDIINLNRQIGFQIGITFRRFLAIRMWRFAQKFLS